MTAKKGSSRRAVAKSAKSTWPVRVDFGEADHERLEACAKNRGLSKASYARQAILAAIRADEHDQGEK